jgi:lipoate-protein ligase A
MSQILLHEITPEQFKELFLEAFRQTHGKAPEFWGMSINGKSFSSEKEKSKEKEVYLTRQQTFCKSRSLHFISTQKMV